jgi:hypothetical protein
VKLPAFPSGFTADFFEQVLPSGFLRSGENIVSVEQSPLGEGTGMMAEISRIRLGVEGNSGARSASLVAKYSSQNPTNREIALLYNLYERESRYFSELDPLTDARCPEIYFTALDGENLVILMEDMSDYDVGSQVIGATLEQTTLAIDELAKLHGSFWQKVDGLDWVPGIAGSYHADNMNNLANMGWDVMVSAFSVPAHINQHRDAFLAAIPALQAQQMSDPLTLCHGDFRMENLLYGAEPGHHPVAVIDWQGPLKGRGMFDVALFLGQSTKTEVRREHEKSLLERYVSGLAAAGVSGLNMADVWADYRRTQLYDWVYAAVVAGTLDSSNEAAFAWMSQMIDRQVKVSEDLDLFDLLPA